MDYTRNFFVKGAILFLVSFFLVLFFSQPNISSAAIGDKIVPNSNAVDIVDGESLKKIVSYEYTVLAEIEINENEKYYIVESNGGREQLIMKESAAVDYDEIENKQEWTTITEAFNDKLAWGNSISSVDDRAAAENFLFKAYEIRLEEKFGDEWELQKGFIDKDNLRRDDYVGFVKNKETGRIMILAHSTLGSDKSDIILLLPGEILNNESLKKDLGFDEAGSARLAALTDADDINQRLIQNLSIDQQIEEAEQTLAIAKANNDTTAINAATSRIRDLQAIQSNNNQQIARQNSRIGSRGLTDGGFLNNQINQAFDVVAEAIGNLVSDFIKFISLVLIQGGALVVGVGGVALNYTVDQFILKMGAVLSYNKFPAINIAWTAMRDMMNIVFIFIMLFISGSIILRYNTSNVKTLLRNVIIVAFLINFSLFFTKAIIDVSNILTLALNENLLSSAEVSGEDSLVVKNGSIAVLNYGISGRILEGLGISESFKASDISINTTEIFLRSIVIFIFLVVTGIILFLIAFMLLYRFVVLIIVMILSPVAFMGYVLPKLKSMVTDKWMDALFKNAFFAPIFFVMLSIVFLIMDQKDQKIAFVSTLSPDLGIMTINFSVMIALLVAALYIANSLGVKGGSYSYNKISGLGAWAKSRSKDGAKNAGLSVYRNTAGRTFSKLLETKSLNNIASKSRVGMVALQGIKGVAEYGGEKSYKSVQNKNNERRVAQAKDLTADNPARRRQLRYNEMKLNEIRNQQKEGREFNQAILDNENSSEEQRANAKLAMKAFDYQTKEYEDKIKKHKKSLAEDNENLKQNYSNTLTKPTILRRAAAAPINIPAAAISKAGIAVAKRFDEDSMIGKAGLEVGLGAERLRTNIRTWVTPSSDTGASDQLRKLVSEEKGERDKKAKEDREKKEKKTEKEKAKKEKEDKKKYDDELLSAIKKLADNKDGQENSDAPGLVNQSGRPL